MSKREEQDSNIDTLGTIQFGQRVYTAEQTDEKIAEAIAAIPEPEMDDEPTPGSDNAVKSNGVYEAIAYAKGELVDMVSIGWSALKTLRDTNKLVPGRQYRITDYVATVADDPHAQSANRPFDLIVVADSENSLNEKARAVQHEGDAYFDGCKMESWQVWYCLDNDQSRFGWADTTQGKGVVYRMIDEWRNDCPYDFKGIQFKRWAITDVVSNTVSGDVIDTLKSIFVTTLNGGRNFAWQDTNIEVSDPNGTVVYTLAVDSSSLSTHYTFDSGDGSDYSLDGSENGVFGNVLKPYYTLLNNIVFTGQGCCYNTFGDNCYSNTFGDSCNGNTFGNDCYSNTFGDECNSNTFGGGCNSNTFMDSCNGNTFGNVCYSNTFGDRCYSNTFGDRCYSNTFGIRCYSNTFGDGCYSNTFGDSCYGNTFVSSCYYSTFGDSCYVNTFGDDCDSNTFGNYCNSNTFGNYCCDNTFEDDCNSNTFGDDCNDNTFGNSCYYNTFGDDCCDNTFGDDPSTPRSYFKYITLEPGVNGVSFDCPTTSDADYCQNITVAKGVSSVSIHVQDVSQTYKTTYEAPGSQTIDVSTL